MISLSGLNRAPSGRRLGRRLSRWASAGFLAGFALGFWSVARGYAAPSPPTPFGCDAPGRRVCYFSIQFASGGVRNFNLRAGEKTLEYGLTPGADRYQMSLDLPNLGDVNRCRTLSVQGHTCRTKLIGTDYND